MALRQDFIFLVIRYMFHILLFTLVLFIARPSFCDTGGWAATYGGAGEDWAAAIQQTEDGGYIVAGWTASFSAVNGDLWVLKLEPDGTVEWQKTYGGADNDKAASIQQTHDRGYVVAGMTQSFGAGDYDAWVLKLTPDGTVEWQKTYGGGGMDAAHSIRQTGDGGYIVAGCTSSFGTGREDFWVLKLRPDGTVEWQKAYGGVDRDEAHSVWQTRDRGYIVAGTTSSFGAGEGDLWVLKLRSDGSVKWQKLYGGAGWEWATSIQQTTEGGYIVAGLTNSFGARGFDSWVLKLRPDGSIHPSCGCVWDIIVPETGSNATILDTSANIKDSYVNPQDSSAMILDTDVSAEVQCPATPYYYGKPL